METVAEENQTTPTNTAMQTNRAAFRALRQSDDIQKIDSISIDISSSGISSCDITERCKHFSIRGFVSKARQKDSKICSPFISDGETGSAEEKFYELPDMIVPTYRWWQCDDCIQGSDPFKEETSVDVVKPSPFTRTSVGDKCKNHLSPSSSKNLSMVKELQSLQENCLPCQSMWKEVKYMPYSSSQCTNDANPMNEGAVVATSNGKFVSPYTPSSSRFQLLQEGSSSQQALKLGSKALGSSLSDRKSASYLKLPTEHLYGDFASTSQGTSKAIMAPPFMGVGSRKCSSTAFRSAQGKHQVEGDSFQRAPMAPPSGYANGNSLSSQKSGYLQGALKDVPFAPPRSPSDTKSMSSQKSVKRWPAQPFGSVRRTSRGTVMGPPKSYPDRRSTSAQKKLTKENGSQSGARQNAKRIVQPLDHVEGTGIVFKGNSDREVQHPAAVAAEVDSFTVSNEDSVAPKPKRTREFSSRGKGAVNGSSDGKAHLNGQSYLKENLNPFGNDSAAAASFGQRREGKAKICVEVFDATRANNITTAHSVPAREFTNSGGSTSGHVDDDEDDDDDDDDDEDYEDEQLQGGRHLRPRRAPKIFSLRKVMDKVKHQSAEPSGRGKGRKPKRKSRSKDEECIVLGNHCSPTRGSKRATTHNYCQENPNITGRTSDPAREVFSPSEKAYNLQRRDKLEAVNKPKKVRNVKRNLSFKKSREKPDPKGGDEKKPRRRNIPLEKSERSNKSSRKRKIGALETKECPTASKGTEVEIERVKHSSPDFSFASGQNKDKVADENIKDATTTASINGDCGDQEGTGKGKEKMVGEDEAGGITMLSFVAAGEGSSSPPKNGTQAVACGRMKDFDINVPAEEIPMDIVELMAKNQLERTCDVAPNKAIIMHDPSRAQTINLGPTETMSAFSAAGISRAHPHPIAMKPLLSDPRNGFYQTGPDDSVSQLSEYYVEVHRSRSQVGYLKDNFPSNSRCVNYAPQYPDQVPVGMPMPSMGSVAPNLRWNNPLPFKIPSRGITQAVDSYTHYQGGTSSLPLNSPTWSPLKPVVQNRISIGGDFGNQGMFSRSTDQLVRPPVNHRSGPLDLFPEESRTNRFFSPQSSHPRTVSEHPYSNTQQKRVHRLSHKGNGPVDMSSQEAIPALQLLDLMHSSGSPSNQTRSGEVYGSRNTEFLNRSLFEQDRLYNKKYREGPHFEPYKNVSASASPRIPFYDSRGGSISMIQQPPPCQHSPVSAVHQYAHTPIFLNNVSAEKRTDGGYVHSPNFSTRDQRSTVRSSVWPSQAVTFVAEKPLNPVYNMVEKHRKVTPSSCKGQAVAAAPPWLSREILYSARKPQSGLGNGVVTRSDQWSRLPTPNTEVCTVNRNPAEITDPRESTKFTIHPEELRRSDHNRPQNMPKGKGFEKFLKT